VAKVRYQIGKRTISMDAAAQKKLFVGYVCFVIRKPTFALINLKGRCGL